MNFSLMTTEQQGSISMLFRTVFSDSEGEKEGAVIGHLASELAASIDNQKTICIGAFDQDELIGSIFFTQLSFSTGELVYMLAPVAVSTARHGQGVGQALIKFGLEELKRRDVQAAVTYGDPAFYSKVGFEPLSEEVIKAPLPLSMPIGWLGQSLTGEPIKEIAEKPSCVQPFNDPSYW